MGQVVEEKGCVHRDDHEHGIDLFCGGKMCVSNFEYSRFKGASGRLAFRAHKTPSAVSLELDKRRRWMT